MKTYVVLVSLFVMNAWLAAQTVKGKVVNQTNDGLSGVQLQMYIGPNVYTTTTYLRGSFEFTNITTVAHDALPDGYVIANNYPNPFNPVTRFMISVPTRAVVRADIFNVLGARVSSIGERVLNAGTNNLDIEMNGNPNGVYFAHITIDGKYSAVKKMMLLYGSAHLSTHQANGGGSMGRTSTLSRSATQAISIDSIVASSPSIARAVFTNLPQIVPGSLNVGNLAVLPSLAQPPMVAVGGGTFQMGNESGHMIDRPIHTVTVSSFYIDKYEVTYENWTNVLKWASDHGYTDIGAGRNGSNPIGTTNPVTMVSWYDVVKLCNARSEREGLTPAYYTDSTLTNVYPSGILELPVAAVKWTSSGYRLPTEAEWEFAAKGGTNTSNFKYSGSNIAEEVGWCASNSSQSTHQVGTKASNELGIYDMTGNVYEWCWDFLTPNYESGPQIDPKGPATRTSTIGWRTNRGACYAGSPTPQDGYNVTIRNGGVPTSADVTIGFRCVRSHNFSGENEIPMPEKFSAISISKDTVRLQWVNRGSSALNFVIEESIDNITYVPIKSTGAGATSVDISGSYASDKTYYFRIKSRLGSLMSEYVYLHYLTDFVYPLIVGSSWEYAYTYHYSNDISGAGQYRDINGTHVWTVSDNTKTSDTSWCATIIQSSVDTTVVTNHPLGSVGTTVTTVAATIDTQKIFTYPDKFVLSFTNRTRSIPKKRVSANDTITFLGAGTPGLTDSRWSAVYNIGLVEDYWWLGGNSSTSNHYMLRRYNKQ